MKQSARRGVQEETDHPLIHPEKNLFYRCRFCGTRPPTRRRFGQNIPTLSYDFVAEKVSLETFRDKFSPQL